MYRDAQIWRAKPVVERSLVVWGGGGWLGCWGCVEGGVWGVTTDPPDVGWGYLVSVWLVGSRGGDGVNIRGKVVPIVPMLTLLSKYTAV